MGQSTDKSAVFNEQKIELVLDDISQLFHSLDPSPFRERDLNESAEDFIVSWAREFSKTSKLELEIHVAKYPPADKGENAVGDAVRNYFTYRASRFEHRNRELLKEGGINLCIGLSFLTICLIMTQYLSGFGEGTMVAILRESLIIGGWVAMWRPMQIFLYDRWPVKQSQKLYQRLAKMSVRLTTDPWPDSIAKDS